jgi:hypothetical protein
MHRRIILAVLAVIGLLLGASSAASASTRPATAKPVLRYLGTIQSGAVSSDTPVYNFCGTTGYCLNDWNGGADIKSYAYGTGGVTNNKFSIFEDTNECNGGVTTSSCPWKGTPAGLFIIVYMVENGGTYNGWCIGDYGDSSTNASSGVVGCPSGSNTGGWGSNFIATTPTLSGCPTDYSSVISLHWNSSWSATDVGLGSPSSNGEQIYNNSDPPTCLGARAS